MIYTNLINYFQSINKPETNFEMKSLNLDGDDTQDNSMSMVMGMDHNENVIYFYNLCLVWD